MEEIKRCPNCKGQNLSDGKSDFLYSVEEGREVPFQFCNDCHTEWLVEEK